MHPIVHIDNTSLLTNKLNWSSWHMVHYIIITKIFTFFTPLTFNPNLYKCEVSHFKWGKKKSCLQFGESSIHVLFKYFSSGVNASILLKYDGLSATRIHNQRTRHSFPMLRPHQFPHHISSSSHIKLQAQWNYNTFLGNY